MSQVKVVLDGALFSECEMLGNNRDGMMRLTEDITQRLVKNKDLDISFSNMQYSEKYENALRNFVKNNYPANAAKILSKESPFLLNLLSRKPFKKYFKKFSPTPYFKELNSYDIFHSFYYPFSKNVLKNDIKRSITYLDIIPLKLKGYPVSLINRTKEIVESIAGNYAISISEFSKQDLLEYDKRINAEKVFVVPLAASTDLFYKNTNVEDWQLIKSKYHLPDNYFLSVAGNDGRKNIPHLVKAFNQFILQEKPQDIHLVLTGNNSHNKSMLDDLKISKEVRDKIFIPDRFIDSGDLAALYSNATSFFFMSLYEGFGLPALEAMQCGVPVVTSNTTSLPEVVGEAGIVISPTDEQELSGVMTKLYNDKELRIKYATASLKRASAFSWQRCADEYAEIFKKIA